MSPPEPITVTTRVRAPLAHVWACWTEPEHICAWNFASPEWCCPSATQDLRVGGRFTSRMQARDGSMGFDFEGTWTVVEPQRRLAYDMDDGRSCAVSFEQDGDVVVVTEVFDPEATNSRDLQQGGWQAILDNFKVYAEAG